MIECSAPVPPGASFVLRCGSIAASSVIVWENEGQCGINFRSPLSEQEVTELLSRNGAIISRRAIRRPPIDEATHRDSGGMAALKKAGSKTSSAAHAARLTPIETAHRQVESSMSALETILANGLSDVAQFSVVRLRLRQANVARTQIALGECRKRSSAKHPRPDLEELKCAELAVSQMISEHVQRWTLQTLRGNWQGYCRASAKVLAAVRALIAREKELLCTPAQERNSRLK